MEWIDTEQQERPMRFINIKVLIDEKYYNEGVKRFGKNKFRDMISKECGLDLSGIPLKELEESWK
jgi:hypothetical protein